MNETPNFLKLNMLIDKVASAPDEYVRNATHNALVQAMDMFAVHTRQIEALTARIDALEAAQQPAPVKTTGPLDHPVYPDRMSDIILNPTVGEFKPIPVKDYNRALNDLCDGIAAAKMGQHDTAHLCMKSALRLLTT